ncbi:hypothetical protein O0I10_000930 [Lichtheimia ornata]|uniref:Uncharacterized protein n=1 Tax=Lichtheimia ornata TaxID=688661 RepID=A0AAD7Y4M6_9FUNG|nr:uncharacterized protein O0I10_000930 [Lichtheimia ornata]KAJ8663681.1 hypothetical protein O0I10_000930 [Lichtheimia ornata]
MTRATTIEDNTGFTGIFNFVRAQVLALIHETARNRREKSLLRAMLRVDPAPGYGFDAITAQGAPCLDYDTGVCIHAMVLKNVDGALFRPLQLIYDWKLLQDSREIVFPVFARTVTYAGRVLRAPIIEELELPEYQRFNYERFGRGFFGNVGCNKTIMLSTYGHLLNNINSLIKIVNRWANIVSTRNSYQDANGQQQQYRTYTIIGFHH